MKHRIAILTGLLIAGVAAIAPADEGFFDHDSPAVSRSNRPQAGEPQGTVDLSINGQDERVWPFTGDDFDAQVEDPINLVFLGQADPRNIRAVLLSLDGNRTAFGLPNAFPFNCTWRDGTGNNQASYAAGAWAAAPIQLECGEYTVMRTHLRLFRYDGFTLGGAHFELMVTNTADHRPLSWEFAERLVKIDLERSGLLGPDPTSTGPFGPTPSWREIDYRVLNGVPAYIRQVVGLPLEIQTANYPIPNDGAATVLDLAGTQPVSPLTVQRSYHREYMIPMPKPFCETGPLDYVLVQGPVDIGFELALTEDGEYHSEQLATGDLTITPFDPITMTPIGPSIKARIRERQNAAFADGTAWGESSREHVLLGDPEQSLREKLRVGSFERYDIEIDCGGQ